MSAPIQKIALIGDPVAHSVSPPLQQAAFNATGLPYEYVAERITPEDLPGSFAGLKERYAGLNVTRPLKEVVLPLLNDFSQEARIAGSVNTIAFAGDGRSHGFSTDGAGFLAAVKRVHHGPIRQAVVLGTGGAARAVAAALAEVAKVTVAGRNRIAGARLSADLQGSGLNVPFVYAEEDPIVHRSLLAGCDLLVNATPLGGPDHADGSPLPGGITPSPDTVVFDLISVPRVTPLLRDAAAANCKVIQGIEMLIEQGALAFTIWTGVPAPVDVMREAAYRASDLQANTAVKNLMLRFLTAGESHGPELVVIVEGMPAGVPIDMQALDNGLRRRQQGHGRGKRSTKIEQDRAQVVSGLAHPASSDGDRMLTTGAPIAIRIINADFVNQPEHPKPLTAPRPGHADLAGGLKYGLANFRLVRERASARETAARSAVGEIARSLLGAFNVRIGSFVTAIGSEQWDADVEAADEPTLIGWADAAEDDPTRCPDVESSRRMFAAIDEAKIARETLGGIFVVFALGLPAGLGSHVHWDRRLDGRLLQAIGSIPAVKGAEVGSAFEIAKLIGSESVDSIKGAELERPTNRAGGVEGGMTNGMPLIVRGAMKPLSSVRREVESFDLATGDVADPGYVRSDICAVPAAGVVGESMIAWVLADALCERFGSDRLDVMLKAYEAATEAAFVNAIWQ